VAVHDAVEELVDLLVVADVEGHGLGPASRRFDHADGLREGLLPPPHADHRRAEAGQFESRRPPQTRARARDHADLLTQEVCHEDP
jgi:hypothetical protein